MSNQLRKIRRNQSELAGVGRCNRYGNLKANNNGFSFKAMREKIKPFLIENIARNDRPENHVGNIQKQTLKNLGVLED